MSQKLVKICGYWGYIPLYSVFISSDVRKYYLPHIRDCSTRLKDLLEGFNSGLSAPAPDKRVSLLVFESEQS